MLPTAAAIARHYRVRVSYVLEPLERRRLFTVMAVDAVVGQPIGGPIATDVALPQSAVDRHSVNVYAGAYDERPRLVKQPDGRYSIYARITPAQAGTLPVLVTAQADEFGRWETIDEGTLRVRSADFSAVLSDVSVYNLLPGTKRTAPVAVFNPSADALPLDRYAVTVNWFGTPRAGYLKALPGGKVGAFLDDAYYPTGNETARSTNPYPQDDGYAVTRVFRQGAADAPPVGFARTMFSVYNDIGIGTFHAQTDGQGLRIYLPNRPIPWYSSNQFTPVGDVTGWASTFTAKVQFQGGPTGDDNISDYVPATLVKETNGGHTVRFPVPDLAYAGGMVKVVETVTRPPIGDLAEQTYTVMYTGSWAGSGDPVETVTAFTTPDPEPPRPNYPAVLSGDPLAAYAAGRPDDFDTTPGPTPEPSLPPDADIDVAAVDPYGIPLPPAPPADTTPPHTMADAVLTNGDDTLFGAANDDEMITLLD